jgi:hypothetical protein
MDPAANQLEQIGEAGEIECHAAFCLSKLFQEHELHLPDLPGNPFLVSEERAHILGRERGSGET